MSGISPSHSLPPQLAPGHCRMCHSLACAHFLVRAGGGGGAGRLPRASPHGSWSVFTTSATAVEEEGEAGCDAGGSGEGEGREGRVAWVYTTNEDRQLWHVPRWVTCMAVHGVQCGTGFVRGCSDVCG